LARLAVNFKNAGNGGILQFLRFFKWKTDGKWKMENALVRKLLDARFAKWPFRGIGLSNASQRAD
jgi:hypothetical protein